MPPPPAESAPAAAAAAAAAAGGAAAAGDVGAPSASPITFERRVQFLGFGFLTLFVAYSSAQLLQTAVNRTYGYVCLLSLYAVFGLAALFAPEVVGRVGPRRLLAMSGVGYVIMVAANLNPVPFLLIPGCIIVGASAATLWSSQGTYVGACSVQLSQRSGRPLTECTSQLNASFYSIFMTSGGISNIFASLIMMSGAPDAVRILFLVLTVAGCAGVVLLASLPDSDDPSAAVVAVPWFLTEFADWRRGRAAASASGKASAAAAAAAAAERSDVWKDGDAATAPSAAASGSSLGDAEAATDGGVERTTSSSSVRRRNTGPEGEQGGHASASAAGSAAGAAAVGAVPAVASSHPSAPGAGGSLGTTTASSSDSSSPPIKPLPPPRPSLLFMLHFLFTNRKMRFLVPTMFLTGAGGGFVSGAWNGGVVARVLGPEYVGFAGATYSLSAALATRMWGKLAQRKGFGRRWAFVLAYCAHITWFAAWALWSSAHLSDVDAAEEESPSLSSLSLLAGFPLAPGPERDKAFAAVFIGAFWFAVFDPVFNSLIPATLQTYFPTGAEAPCAMASIRAVYSVGFSLQQGVSIALGGRHVAAQASGLLCFALVAASCLAYLHLSVAPIDGPGATPLAAAVAGSGEGSTEGGVKDAAAPPAQALHGGLTFEEWGDQAEKVEDGVKR